jgi:hypothetical protein
MSGRTLRLASARGGEIQIESKYLLHKPLDRSPVKATPVGLLVRTSKDHTKN